MPEIASLTLIVSTAVVLIYRGQIADRAPLAWDEAARGYAGLQLADALDQHSLAAVFHWINAQTFFPALASAPTGVLMWLGVGIQTAAWLPTLFFFVLAGFAIAALSHVLRLPTIACVASAAVFWFTPLLAKISAGSFTEPLGICVEVAILIGLSLQARRSSFAVAALLGLGIGLATAVKYDYGILCFATVGLAEGIRFLSVRRLEAFYTAAVSVVSGLALAGIQFAFNSSAKIAGASDVISSNSGSAAKRYAKAFTAGRAGDFMYYPRLLFRGGELGLSRLVALCMVVGVITALIWARKRPEWRPPMIFLGLWWVMYSLSRAKFPRYAATSLPVLSIAAC
ncbi:MAG: hypothetical protein QOF78_2847, partial [Phycisphaerales bacterium]|nr:hypothetical protein [Phycisphaerales bacterium]